MVENVSPDVGTPDGPPSEDVEAASRGGAEMGWRLVEALLRQAAGESVGRRPGWAGAARAGRQRSRLPQLQAPQGALSPTPQASGGGGGKRAAEAAPGPLSMETWDALLHRNRVNEPEAQQDGTGDSRAGETWLESRRRGAAQVPLGAWRVWDPHPSASGETQPPLLARGLLLSSPSSTENLPPRNRLLPTACPQIPTHSGPSQEPRSFPIIPPVHRTPMALRGCCSHCYVPLPPTIGSSPSSHVAGSSAACEPHPSHCEVEPCFLPCRRRGPFCPSRHEPGLPAQCSMPADDCLGLDSRPQGSGSPAHRLCKWRPPGHHP